MPHHPIQFKNFCLSFPHRTFFENFNTQVHFGSRIAIVGRNGSGKSTFLKALKEAHSSSNSTIKVPSDVVFGHVPQIIEDFKSLSGGQRFHQALSQALALKPNVLLLDEPSNHLDLRNRQSLFRKLKLYPGTLIAVSHDVELIRNCMDTVWHMDHGKIHTFSGNYDDYLQHLQQKQTTLEQTLKRLENQKKSMHQDLMREQKRAAHSKNRGEKKRAQAHWPTMVADGKQRQGQETTGRKKSALAEHKHELMEKLSELQIPEIIKPRFLITASDLRSKILLSIRDGSVGYGEPPLLKKIHLSVAGGERIAIYGNNGSGKSTLLKAILSDPRVYRWGEWQTPKPESIGYLDQHYATLNPQKTVFETIGHTAPQWNSVEIKRHLNDFLFRTPKEIEVLVSMLSGGERARLSLAILAAKTPPLLILDEATNNLDLETRNHVIQVLQKYPGALILISHDEHFLKEVKVETFYDIHRDFNIVK